MKKQILGALAPQFDLAGPTVDDDITRLISRWGLESVRESASRLTKKRRGRKKLPDFRDLIPWIDEDARVWIAGADPFKKKSAYAIAKEFAALHPGQSQASTIDRIEEKLLSKKHGRIWYVLVRAEEMTRSEHPYLRHLAALKAIADHDDHIFWRRSLKQFEQAIADYIAKWGEPEAMLTATEIEEGASRPLPTKTGLLANRAGGMGGILQDILDEMKGR